MISLFDKSRPVLVLSPHPDDAELGCGGTIARLVEDDFKVRLVTMSMPLEELYLESVKAAQALGVSMDRLPTPGDAWPPGSSIRLETRHFPAKRQTILEALVEMRKRYDPGCVFVPATTDVHQDHQTVTEEAYRAFRHRTILGYYEPWNTPKMEPSVYVTLSGAMVQKKLEALACYTSQAKRPYFGEQSVHAVLRTWGLQSGTTWAEAFELVRGVVV